MSRSARLLLDAAIAVGAVYAVVFVVVALWRAPFGFELEWMEGGMVSHAARLLDGQSIYVKPSADFVPFFYTPGYPLVLAGLAQVVGGLSLALGRAVSIAATLVTLGILFGIGRREGSWREGALAVGVYAALFRTNGAFYDLARPDALFIALVAGGTYGAYYWRSLGGAMAAGALFAVAFLTKQTTSVFVPAVGLYLLWRKGPEGNNSDQRGREIAHLPPARPEAATQAHHEVRQGSGRGRKRRQVCEIASAALSYCLTVPNWRHAVGFGGVAVGLVAVGVGIGTRMTDGWMWTYIFEGHQGHLFYWKNILLEYWRDVLFVAPLLLLLPLLWFGYKVPVVILSVLLAAHWSYAFIFRASGFSDFPHMYYRELWYLSPRWLLFVPPALIAGLLGVYRSLNPGPWQPRTHGFWLLMFVAGAGSSGLNHSTQWAYSNSLMPISLFASVLVALAVRDLVAVSEERRPRWGALVPAAVLVQLVAWAYDPRAQVPGAEDEAALARVEARLSVVEGAVFVPAHPLWSWHRDGNVHVHQMGIQDVAFLGGVSDLGARLGRGEWAAVVVDEHNRVPGVERGYYLGDRFEFAGDALRTKTGFLVRPSELWLRQDGIERALSDGISGNFEGGVASGWVSDAGVSDAGVRSDAGVSDAGVSDGRVFAASKASVAGRQGRWVLRSSVAGVGVVRSGAMVVGGGRLSLLVGGQASPAEVRVVVAGVVVARRGVGRVAGRGAGRRGGGMERVSLDVRGVVGQMGVVEVVDRDAKGWVAVDDLRWVD